MTLELSNETLRNENASRLEEISGVNLSACYQCGNCSAGCPCVEVMEMLPHRVIRMCQFGRFESLAQVNTMWVCAACMTCSVRCPKGIDIAAVMEGLRNLVLRNRESSDYIRMADIDESLYKELPQIALINNLRKLTL